MAIILVTGLPGHGKTLYTISRFKAEAEKSGREVFQCSGEPDASVRRAGVLKPITGLKLPWPTIDPMQWHLAPAGSLVIIDEAQFVFPTRGRGEPPDWVARLATHRHLGIDIVLITQNPMLMDSFVRRLIDQHFHIVRKFGTHFATIHEFANGAKENVAVSREGSIRHEWRYPKDVFELYQSAEVHTVKRRLPARVFVLLALPLVLGGLVWYGYNRLNPEDVGKRMGSAPVKDQKSGGILSGVNAAAGAGAGAGQAQVLDAVAYAEQYRPRVEGLPHTAPAYDEVTKPMDAPYPAACISSKSRCRCYSQQATVLDMPSDLCNAFVKGGFFQAWARAKDQSNGSPSGRSEERARPLGETSGEVAGSVVRSPQDVGPGPISLSGGGAGGQPPVAEPAQSRQTPRRKT